ncbi:redoxin domain-containing protein [Streptomyces microflavus]|uniref:redoxin domain-containing protein n=1 Tax=Streptomyces microflavus TaxID=1919 RepID=UPI0033F31F0B
MRARTLIPGTLAAVLLALTGCGTEGGAADTTETLPKEPTASAPAAAPSGDGGKSDSTSVPAALKFTGTTVEGKPFDATSLAGKPTVLWFWAPWCPKCRAQAAETAKVAAEYAGRAHVVGVAGLDETAAMQKFVADTGTSDFTHLADENGDVWKRFEVTEQSRYVILDKNGETAYEGVLPGGKGLADKVAGLAG